MKNIAIIEIGAFDALDGLAFALNNPNLKVSAFEGNSFQI